MLNITIGGISCKISLLFPAVLLYLMYIDQSGMPLFCFSAAMVHECGHLAAAYGLRCRPKDMAISCFGIRLTMNDSLYLSPVKHAVMAFAGPFFNILSAAVLYALNVDAIYAQLHMVMAVFNLLPIMPLDGGQVVHTVLLQKMRAEQAQRAETWLFWMTWFPLFGLGIGMLVSASHNITLMIVSLYLLFIRLFYNGN